MFPQSHRLFTQKCAVVCRYGGLPYLALAGEPNHGNPGLHDKEGK